MSVKILNKFIEKFGNRDIDKSFYALKQFKKLMEEGIINGN